MEISILGTRYKIIYESFGDKDADGYCDYTSREIHIRCDNTHSVGNFESLRKLALRHEIIHGFLAESGLQANWEHANDFGHDETMVDWVAIQFSKLQKAFIEAECL